MTSTPEGRLFINGEFIDARSGRTFEVINPADETVVAHAADADAEDVDLAVSAARRAFDESRWVADHEFRASCLSQLQAGLSKEADAIVDILVREAGTPTSVMGTHVQAMTDDMSYFIDMIGRFPWESDYGTHEVLGMASRRHVRYEPYGVVGAITPWNAPYMTALWKITHSLATGNTVVLKTAPDTPLSAALIAQVAAESTDIPPGVLNVLSSADKAQVGEALTGDPRVDMFTFTGSPGVGQRIAERAAVGIRKVILELGGKSANVILPDADLDVAMALGSMMCLANSGQGCALATRMVVHADVYDQLVEGMVDFFPKYATWGDPADPANLVGPIIRAEQLDRMAGLVDRARADGAEVVVGGRRGDRYERGFWYEPTLIVGADPMSEIAQTEVFGPVLTVVRYDGDDDEAVRVANSTPYGLSGYVQSGSDERAWNVARKLRAGTVNIGASFYLSPDTPFGGYGISGVGREHGEDGFREFVQSKTIASPVV